MILMNLFAVVTLMAAASASAKSAYEVFDLPVAKLPRGCVKSDLSPNEKTPRPFVLSTNKHVKAFCEGDLPGLIDYSTTKEMFILCFREKNEIGIYGWRLTSAESASALFAKASAKYANRAADMKLWINNDVVVLLWRDQGVTDACFQIFQEHVARTISKMKPDPTIP